MWLLPRVLAGKSRLVDQLAHNFCSSEQKELLTDSFLQETKEFMDLKMNVPTNITNPSTSPWLLCSMTTKPGGGKRPVQLVVSRINFPSCCHLT